MDEDEVDNDDFHPTEPSTRKRNSKPKASKTDEKISRQKKDDATRMDGDEEDFHSTEPTSKKGILKLKENVMKSTEKVSSQKKDDAFTIMDEDEVDNDDFHSTESTTEQRNSKPKENVMKSTAKASKTDERPNNENLALFPSLHSRYEVAPRRSSLPMSELIRRANSAIGSPLSTLASQPRTSSLSATRPIKPSTPISTNTTYSPCLKSSRSFLSRIAPLHPNRRTPPLPLPPSPKKTKKELELEEKWE